MKALVLAGVALAAAFASAADNCTRTVTLDPSASIIWKTAVAGQRAVSLLPWPQGAVSAVLASTPGGSVVITDTTLATYDLARALPLKEADETVLKLKLEYKDGSGAVIETRNAVVGFVCGTAASSDIAYRTPDGNSWTRHTSKKPVVPVPADVDSLALDGEALGFSAAPTWALLAAGSGAEHTLAWSGENCEGEIAYSVPCSMMILVR